MANEDLFWFETKLTHGLYQQNFFAPVELPDGLIFEPINLSINENYSQVSCKIVLDFDEIKLEKEYKVLKSYQLEWLLKYLIKHSYQSISSLLLTNFASKELSESLDTIAFKDSLKDSSIHIQTLKNSVSEVAVLSMIHYYYLTLVAIFSDPVIRSDPTVKDFFKSDENLPLAYATNSHLGNVMSLLNTKNTSKIAYSYAKELNAAKNAMNESNKIQGLFFQSLYGSLYELFKISQINNYANDVDTKASLENFLKCESGFLSAFSFPFLSIFSILESRIESFKLALDSYETSKAGPKSNVETTGSVNEKDNSQMAAKEFVNSFKPIVDIMVTNQKSLVNSIENILESL
ncbi:MAG: hypothetical protein MHPSP_000854 [Paramarteilia canceri]